MKEIVKNDRTEYCRNIKNWYKEFLTLNPNVLFKHNHVLIDPMFNLVKGILVTDPIEARRININHNSEIYLLFQINTTVGRSKQLSTPRHSYRWTEDSQCRFDIGPSESIPVLRVLLMEDVKPVPKVLDQAEMDLLEIFHSKNVDKWVTFRGGVQLNLEFTFYEIAPIIPSKNGQYKEQSQQEQLLINLDDDLKPVPPKKDGLVIEEPAKLLSAVDQVFDDSKEERSKLHNIVKRVKRRYRESKEHHQKYHMSRQSSLSSKRSMSLRRKKSSSSLSFNPLETEIETENQAKERRPQPQDLSSRASTITQQFPKESGSYDISDDLGLIDLNYVPFSADEIGGADFDILLNKERLRHQQKVAHDIKVQYQRMEPVEFAIAKRFEHGMIKDKDFEVDPGASEYNGDGTWKKGCLRDSYRVGEPPKIPLKIPIGMTNEEFFALNRSQLQII